MFSTADSEEISQVTSLGENSNSAASDESGAPEATHTANKQNRELTVNMLFKEMIFCIALALTTYGALHNAPPKVSKHPNPVRFFSEDSLVTDWYGGELIEALVGVNRADVSVVMYYAPWDAECQHVRGEYEKVASVLGDRVHVSAINCWNPHSECRLQHSKIPSWPIIMVYTVNSRGIIYKGPRDAQSMITFIELIMKPIKRVSSTEDLVNLLSFCDAVAVGYTPLLDSSLSYNVWYNVALKVRELDTIGEICFASVTSEDLAVDLGVDIIPAARLMLWNDTKEYSKQPWNDTLIAKWVVENFSQPVLRITTMWRKSYSFKPVGEGNPILILFTPLNPLYEQIPYYSILREVAMEYYSCNENTSNQWTSELIKLQQVQRLLFQQRDVIKYCQEYQFKKQPKPISFFQKKEVVTQYPWQNTTQKNQTTSFFNLLLKRGVAISKLMESGEVDAGYLTTLGLFDECTTHTFPAGKDYYDREKCPTVEDNLMMDADSHHQNLGTTMLPSEDDVLSTENLYQDSIKHYCNVMKFAHQVGPPILPPKELNTNKTHILGLACMKNFTLRMIAMDSVRNHHFAESLGIDIRKKKDMTAVVILDSKHESQYILSEEYSAKSVKEFIYNFTYSKLKRTLRTQIQDAAHTHYFGSDGPVRQSDVVREPEIIDLTTRTFRRVINTPGKLTIVAVCAGACSALTSLAGAAGARLASACGAPARFARLDALRHDLPFHYSPPHYPAIIVFPADRSREAESRAFPPEQRVSGSAVVALVLQALGSPLHLRVRLALCQRTRSTSEKKSCLRDIREHVTSVIGRNLKYWRRAASSLLKNAFFDRLERLRLVSFHISLLHITDLVDGNAKLDELVSSLTSLAKYWTIDESLLHKSKTHIQKKTKS